MTGLGDINGTYNNGSLGGIMKSPATTTPERILVPAPFVAGRPPHLEFVDKHEFWDGGKHGEGEKNFNLSSSMFSWVATDCTNMKISLSALIVILMFLWITTVIVVICLYKKLNERNRLINLLTVGDGRRSEEGGDCNVLLDDESREEDEFEEEDEDDCERGGSPSSGGPPPGDSSGLFGGPGNSGTQTMPKGAIGGPSDSPGHCDDDTTDPKGEYSGGLPVKPRRRSNGNDFGGKVYVKVEQSGDDEGPPDHIPPPPPLPQD